MEVLLALFDLFGYEWLCSSSANRICSQLHDVTNKHLKPTILKLANTPDSTEGVYIIEAPDSWRGFAIITPNVLHPKGEKVTATWMPFFERTYEPPKLEDISEDHPLKFRVIGPLIQDYLYLKQQFSGACVVREVLSSA